MNDINRISGTLLFNILIAFPLGEWINGYTYIRDEGNSNQIQHKQEPIKVKVNCC